MKSDVEINCIELQAEVERKQSEIYIAAVEYETSEGLKAMGFNSENRIIGFANEITGMFEIEEKGTAAELNKILAHNNLKSIVSFTVEKKK